MQLPALRSAGGRGQVCPTPSPTPVPGKVTRPWRRARRARRCSRVPRWPGGPGRTAASDVPVAARLGPAFAWPFLHAGPELPAAQRRTLRPQGKGGSMGSDFCPCRGVGVPGRRQQPLTPSNGSHWTCFKSHFSLGAEGRQFRSLKITEALERGPGPPDCCPHGVEGSSVGDSRETPPLFPDLRGGSRVIVGA